MKRVFLIVTALCLMLSVFVGCNNGQKGYKTTDSGLQYRFHVTNQGNLPKEGDIIDFDWKCTVNDTIILIPAQPYMIKLQKPAYEGDLMEGMAMMHIGDSASFIVNIDSAAYYIFGDQQLMDMYGDDDIMRFDIKINDFYPEDELVIKMVEAIKQHYPEESAKAEAEMKQYFADNNIVATPTASGLYYVQTAEGNGEMPAKGDYVHVHYTGKLLNGKVFDSSIERGEPIGVSIGVGRVIPGWDEGIMMMSKGEKGVLYIPYYLGYGDRGAGSDIPPFANLIFEVELIDFE